jgi:SAM-dependent methyltransferase
MTPHPRIVAELGPGDTLGTGLAALLSGAERYFAFDVVAYANVQGNLRVLDELLALFRSRADIPGESEWPRVSPKLNSYAFPHDILNTETLRRLLSDDRIDRIRESIRNPESGTSMISYKVPWLGADVLESETVDLIFSQAVLEHVDDLEVTYRSMYAWLKPGGYATHSIDFRAHGTADSWNGHWAYTDLQWKLIRGRRPFLINRLPHSAHISLMKDAGFAVVHDQRVQERSSLDTRKLARRFCGISSTDLSTAGTFVVTVKPA